MADSVLRENPQLSNSNSGYFNKTNRPLTGNVLKPKTLNDETCLMYGQPLQSALQRASLSRVSAYHSRDLIDSHAERTGKDKVEIIRELNRRPYSARPAALVARVPEVKKASMMDEVKIIQDTRASASEAEAVFRSDTRNLVNKWDDENARFELESVKRTEYSQLKHRSKSAPHFKAPNVSEDLVGAWSVDTTTEKRPVSAWSGFNGPSKLLSSNMSNTVNNATAGKVRPYSAVGSLAQRQTPNLTRPVSSFNSGGERITIDRVKLALMKHGMHVSQKSLDRALLTPIVEISETERKILLSTPSSSLLRNPFAEVKKTASKETKAKKPKGKKKKSKK